MSTENEAKYNLCTYAHISSLSRGDNSNAKEIERKIAMAKSAVQNLTTIWRARGVSIRLKTRLLKSTVFANELYGCESWALTEADRKKINALEMWCYRKLLCVSWTEKRTYKCILEKIGSSLILRKNIKRGR